MTSNKEKPISSTWIKAFPSDDEKNKFKGKLLSAQEVIERLDDILDEKIREARKTNPTDFDKASWAYYRAYEDGKIAAYEETKQLTKHSK